MQKRIRAGAKLTERKIKAYKRRKLVNHGNPVGNGTEVDPAHVVRDRRGDQRGVNEIHSKILSIGKNGLVPKNTSNPRILGTV